MHLAATLKGFGVSACREEGKFRKDFLFRGKLDSFGSDVASIQTLTSQQRASLLASEVWLNVEFLDAGSLPRIIGISPDQIGARVDSVMQWNERLSRQHGMSLRSAFSSFAVIVRQPQFLGAHNSESDVVSIYVALSKSDEPVLGEQIQFAISERRVSLQFSTSLNLRAEEIDGPFPTGGEFFNDGFDGFALSDDLKFFFRSDT